MKSFALLWALLLVLSPQIASAVTCRELMDELSRETQVPGNSESQDEASPYTTPTLTIKASRSGPRGGKIYSVFRTGASWRSESCSDEKGFDPQGDPRWFADTFGEEVAEFFGYRLIDSHHMEVPNRIEFENTVELVNQWLETNGREPLTVHFYDASLNPGSKVAEYVRRFRETHSIPMAPEGNHFFHDVNFHTGAILIPQEVMEYSSELFRFYFEFFEYAKRVYDDEPNSIKAIKYYQFVFDYISTINIDNATGTLGPQLARALQDTQVTTDDRVASIFGRLLFGQSQMSRERANRHTPVEHLRRRVLDMKEAKQWDPKKAKIHQTAMGIAVLESLINPFGKEFRQNNPDSILDPTAPPYRDYVAELDRLCKITTRKRLDLVEAVRHLGKMQGPPSN